MAKIIPINITVQEQQPSELEKCISGCKTKFDKILSEVQQGNQEAHIMEASIFKQLMELGFLLLKVFFTNQNQGNYGEVIKTDKGIAKRGRVSDKSYYSIFGKLKVTRYLYHICEGSFAPLDIVLNLPVRCYSYFLSEMVNMLDIKGAYSEGVQFLKKFFYLKFSVSAAETISDESARDYVDYYDQKDTLPQPTNEEEYTTVGFDGKGVPMIKKEAAKIKGRQGKGEKKQKKKESLVGVNYNVKPNIRTAEQVANNLVFPEKNSEKIELEKAQNIRYIASIEQPKREVMEEIKKEIKDEDFKTKPLICVMDGAKCLWDTFNDVFKDIKNKVLILDIIHVLEYIWLIAYIKFKEGSDEAKEYVYKRLLLILKGGIGSYIKELQKEKLDEKLKKSQQEKLSKVITYFSNHKQYMKYEQYLAQGYTIASGVVESACGHIVKDRMELSGARWGINGAESILKLRSVAKSNDWDDYWKFFIKQAQKNYISSNGFNPLKIQLKAAA
jgi:hypothetical protein